VHFEPTDSQRAVQELARDFAEAEIAPNAAAWDRAERFPAELVPRLAELGLLGVCVPEELGGAGADFTSYILALEELSRADASVGVTVAVHTSAVALPILAFGTAAQRERFVPPLARGEHLGAFALTEPEAGSDAGALRLRAERDGDGWRLHGRKQWITNGSHAGLVLTFARSEPDRPRGRGVSAFLVDGDAPGLRAVREEEKLGLHASSTADLEYDGVPAGADRLLAGRGEGFRVAMATLDGGRIGIAAQAVGIAQAALDVAVAHARDRRQFGRRIGEFGQVQARLADMAVAVDAARLLTLRAAWLKDAGRPHAAAGARAKLFASTAARTVTGDAIQVLGGYGYTRELPAERLYRDAKVTELYEGTSEIQRLVIARDLLGVGLAREPAS
jgi:alkylation response protein AidB-like acyl-CoA dehydrogenase